MSIAEKIEELSGNGIAPDLREFKIPPKASPQCNSVTTRHKIRTGERSDVSRPIPGAALYWIGTLVIGGLTSCRSPSRSARGIIFAHSQPPLSPEQHAMGKPICDRYWFLTWTMYGNRLAGDAKGFVSNVREGAGPEVRHNIPGTPHDTDIPGLEAYVQDQMKGPPVRIDGTQADALWQQFLETSDIRKWFLMAVSIMVQHIHVVVGVPGDPDPERILNDFKRYGSQQLNRSWTTPKSGRWWTRRGSKRKLQNAAAVLAAIKYTIDQDFPLLVWTAPIPELELPGGRIDLPTRNPPASGAT